ncbi:MAG: hypothetical protein ACLFT0_08765 [Spirulinaceae cyanobacterium]
MNFNPIRFLTICFFCAVIFLTSAIPAQAARSPIDKGAEQLNEVQKETDKAMRSVPDNIEEIQEKTRDGLNAVQGSADRDKMKGPESVTQTDTMADKFKKGVEEVLGKD